MSEQQNRNCLERESGLAADNQAAGSANANRASALGSLPAAPRRFWLPLSIGVFIISAGLLFYDLGHYPLWCDEADNALFGKAIARTGDLTAMLDHNINANRHGECLKNLRGRYQPPLPYYVSAPFVGATGRGSFWPRMPFAVCGLACVALMLYWMSRSQLPAITWGVLSLGLLGNVSFFLFCRQCRYYSLATLFSLAIVYFYLYRNGKSWKLAALTVVSILLCATHYLAYAGLYGALCCDYLLFVRRRQPFTPRQLFWVLAPQVTIGLIMFWIYNPLNSSAVPVHAGRNLLLDKLTLMWWNLRDLNSCEFGVGVLMLAAGALYWLDKNVWLLRALLAILSYAIVVAIGSPQPVFMTHASDIRYLAALIPLCIFLTGLSVLTLTRYMSFIAIPLAIVAFETNILNHPLTPDKWRSSICQWIDELKTARTTSIQQAVDWINENVQPGQSVWVFPDYFTYPLMYHAPHALYAWQLLLPVQEQFKDLPMIHFVGGDPPDYIVAFGRREEVEQVLDFLQQRRNVVYDMASSIDSYWDEMTRPELFWRSFKPKVDYNPDIDGVYILRRRGLQQKSP